MEDKHQRYVAAFNQWMDDYTNDPDKFADITGLAIKHLKERSEDAEPTYGEVAAVTFECYLAKTQ